MSQRATAKVLGVSHTQVQRDLDDGTNVPDVTEINKQNQSDIDDVGTEVPPPLSGSEVAKLTEQRNFVIWWDGAGLRIGGKPSQTDDGYVAGKDGIPDRDTIHRWRKRLKDDSRFTAELEKANARCIKPEGTRPFAAGRRAPQFPSGCI